MSLNINQNTASCLEKVIIQLIANADLIIVKNEGTKEYDFEFPMVTLPRESLMKALKERLSHSSSICVHLGVSFSSIINNNNNNNNKNDNNINNGQQVEIELSNGMIEKCDVLIAADGIFSSIRRSLFPHSSLEKVHTFFLLFIQFSTYYYYFTRLHLHHFEEYVIWNKVKNGEMMDFYHFVLIIKLNSWLLNCTKAMMSTGLLIFVRFNLLIIIFD